MRSAGHHFLTLAGVQRKRVPEIESEVLIRWAAERFLRLTRNWT